MLRNLPSDGPHKTTTGSRRITNLISNSQYQESVQKCLIGQVTTCEASQIS
jgi:hypothetical protein